MDELIKIRESRMNGEYAKTVDARELHKFLELERPILIGTSRKSFLTKTLGYPDSDKERIEGTVATNIIGLINGARIFRVHDVGFHKKALQMAWDVINSK